MGRERRRRGTDVERVLDHCDEEVRIPTFRTPSGPPRLSCPHEYIRRPYRGPPLPTRMGEEGRSTRVTPERLRNSHTGPSKFRGNKRKWDRFNREVVKIIWETQTVEKNGSTLDYVDNYFETFCVDRWVSPSLNFHTVKWIYTCDYTYTSRTVDLSLSWIGCRTTTEGLIEGGIDFTVISSLRLRAKWPCIRGTVLV